MADDSASRGRSSGRPRGPEDDRVLARAEVADDDDGIVPATVVEAAPDAADAPVGPLTVGELVDGTREAFESVASHARRLIDRGRYRKLRITRKGKAVLPDIPIAAAAALEAASLYGAGLARVLAVNVGARFLFDVEVINEADKYYERGKEALLDGDLDRACEALEKAVRIDDTHAGAFLQLGVLYRLRQHPEAARRMLSRARSLDENGEVGRRAEEILRALESREADRGDG